MVEQINATNHERIDNLLLPPPQKHPHQLPPPTVVIEKVYISYFEGTNNDEIEDTK